MGPETVLLTVRPGDEGHGKKLAQTAVDIAGPADARVVVAQVFTEDEFKATTTGLGLSDSKDEEQEEVPAEKIADQHGTCSAVVDHLDAAGLHFEIHNAIGPHAKTIVEFAEDADFLIIGGRTRSPAGKALFGSATQDILLSTGCPVVYVRREQTA